MTASPYVHLLISVIHPTYEMTTNRYTVSLAAADPRLRAFDIDQWAEPPMRRLLLGLLCEDWLTDGCEVVGCEQVAGAVQWQRVGSDQ
jgi:hypothetical protein